MEDLNTEKNFLYSRPITTLLISTVLLGNHYTSRIKELSKVKFEETFFKQKNKKTER